MGSMAPGTRVAMLLVDKRLLLLTTRYGIAMYQNVSTVQRPSANSGEGSPGRDQLGWERFRGNWKPYGTVQ